MQYTIKVEAGLTDPITVKLTNHSVLCFLKNSLKILKRFCNLYSF